MPKTPDKKQPSAKSLGSGMVAQAASKAQSANARRRGQLDDIMGEINAQRGAPTKTKPKK